jgi:alpha-L-arabinofuranosidase
LWAASTLTVAPASGQPGSAVPASASVPATPQVRIVTNASTVIRPHLPSTLFGYNIRWTHFERDLWDAGKQQVKAQVIEGLRQMPGQILRYPGGLVANDFDWESTMAPMAQRLQRNKTLRPRDAIPIFGVNEYFDFVKKVQGHAWYTLNLVGKDGREEAADVVAESNKRLAQHMLGAGEWGADRHYFELGNELDRAKYQWPHAKYVSRSLASINAIAGVDPDARFVAFLREFNWNYNPPAAPGVSRYDAFITDVLTGLPTVNDFSLHLYYDGSNKGGGKFFDVADSMDKVRKAIAVAEHVREDRPVNVWITEHGRRIEVNARNEETSKVITSNLNAAVSTGDFLIAAAQVPEIQGAAWQALHGVGRQVFDASVNHGDMRPRPIFWAFRVLYEAGDWAVLDTATQGANSSGYPGGYDVRSATLVNPAKDTFVVWVINRANREVPAELVLAALKARAATIRHDYIAGKVGVDADEVGDNYTLQVDAPATPQNVTDSGAIALRLPPSSVNKFIVKAAGGSP